MKIHLHKNAKTTPAQRAYIQKSIQINTSELADKLGISEATVRKWRRRTSVFDRSHVPKKIATALTPAQEIIVVLIRLCLRSGLDDLQKIVQHFIYPKCSRSGLNRYLKRYQISRLESIAHRFPGNLKDHRGIYLYYTVIHLHGLSDTRQSCLIHLVMDCTSRWIHGDVTSPACLESSSHFIKRFIKKFPVKILGILTMDPIELSDSADHPHTMATGHRPLITGFCKVFDLHCIWLDNYHSTTLDLLKKRTVQALEPPIELKNRLMKHMTVYNTVLRQRTLKQKTPQEMIHHRYRLFPGSFNFKPKQSGRTIFP